MDFAQARHNMVESQIRTNKVTAARILETMEELPREIFVPAERRGIAYIDDDLPLGKGRALMAPMALARLVQAAAVQSGDLVQVVAAGTGYSAALLARLAGSVVAVESDPEFCRRAGEIMAELAIDNVAVVQGPLTEGWAKAAPYNVILIDGAVAEIPEAISAQLGEGGRLVAMMTEGAVARGTLISRFSGRLSRLTLFEAGAPVLKDFLRAPSFSF